MGKKKRQRRYNLSIVVARIALVVIGIALVLCGVCFALNGDIGMAAYLVVPGIGALRIVAVAKPL